MDAQGYTAAPFRNEPGGLVYDREGRVVAYHELLLACFNIADALSSAQGKERARLLEMGERSKAALEGRRAMHALAEAARGVPRGGKQGR